MDPQRIHCVSLIRTKRFGLQRTCCHTGNRRVGLTSSHFDWPILFPLICASNGRMNVKSGCGFILSPGLLRPKRSTISASPLRSSAGSTLGTVRAFCDKANTQQSSITRCAISMANVLRSSRRSSCPITFTRSWFKTRNIPWKTYCEVGRHSVLERLIDYAAALGLYGNEAILTGSCETRSIFATVCVTSAGIQAEPV